jgi:hypothetical protein
MKNGTVLLGDYSGCATESFKFAEDITQSSGLEYQLYERLPIFNRDRLAAHDPHRSVTEQSFPLFPDVIGMSPIVRKLKIVPPLKTY